MKLLSRLLLVTVLFAACEQEIYEKGDSASSYLRADFVEAHVNDNRQVDYVLTDDGEQLQLKVPYTDKWIIRGDTLYRALMYHNYVGQTADVKSLSRIPMFFARRDALGISKWKQDPVGLETIWLSKTKKYLNLGLLLKSGEISEDQQPHALGIVMGGITLNADSTYTCDMALSHWQGDVPEYYTQRNYLSISLEGLEVDTLRFTLNTFDGLVTKSFVLRQPKAK